MAEEQTPSAQPTEKQTSTQRQIGDYYYAGNKVYVYEAKFGKKWDGSFGMYNQYVEYDNILTVPPEKLKRFAPHTTPLTLGDQLANGVSLDGMVAINNDLEEALGTGNKITLGKLSDRTRPTEGTVYRYPVAEGDQGGIDANADYVLFEFYNYTPPFGYERKVQSVAGGRKVFDYNMAEEYTPATGYAPTMIYMPEDISTGFRANWDGKSMSNLATDALRALGQKGLGNKTATAVSGIKNFTDKMDALAGAAIVQTATSKLGGDSLSYDDIFGGISGAIFNPNTELLFGGIQMRNFQLSFKLVPRHAKESTHINNMIKQFKQAMLPSSEPGEVFGKNQNNKNLGVKLGFIGVPKLVRVSFMKGSGEHPVLPRYKMCALTSMDVNYTPDGTYATYNDQQGQPVAIGLQLNFQETKICFAEDVKNNNIR